MIGTIIREFIGHRLMLWALGILPRSAARDRLNEAAILYSATIVAESLEDLHDRQRRRAG